MNEQKRLGEDLVDKVGTVAPLSTDALLKMMLATQAQLAESQKALADAILQSRIPYVDPKVLEQKQRDLEERRRMIAAEQRERVMRKRVCPHVRDNGTSNIKWMEHSNGITKGVCGTCFSEFDTKEPADLDLLRKDLKSIRNMGRAGAHARRGVVLEA